MRKTQVMFFFDTEDFTSQRSAQAILREAEICREEGVVGHFALVGLLAQQLERWGRRDILDVLGGHIIGTHSYGHTLHPDICEVSDCESFAEAFEAVARDEDRALEMIRGAVGTDEILFACPPGNSKSYAAMYYYASRGIPFYCDTVVQDARGTALHYCNAEHIGYFRSMEGVFFGWNTDVAGLVEQIYEKKDRAIIYTHPNVAVKTEFWDALNYRKENLREFGDWIEAPDRDAAQTEMFYAKMRELLRRLKSDERFELTDLRALLAQRKERVALTRELLPGVREALRGEWGPVREPSFSLSDMFCGVVELLRGQERYEPGTAFGFLSAPVGVQETCTVTAMGLREAAKSITIGTFLPEEIEVDGVRLGPADYLLAALDVLVDGCVKVLITPKEQLMSLDAFPELRDFSLRGTWMHADTLEDRYLSQRLRLQCWTLRYE